jgi:hypothetical protein
MHTGRGIQLGICVDHVRRHRAPRGHARDVHARGIDVVGRDDVARDTCDQRWLAALAMLILRFEPVPALRRIGLLRLHRISDKTSMPLGKRVHLRACCEIVGILGAAVEHHNQWQGLAGRPRGDIQSILTTAGGIRIRMRAEMAPVLHVNAVFSCPVNGCFVCLCKWEDDGLRLLVSPRGFAHCTGALPSQGALYCFGRVGSAAGTQQSHRFAHRIQEAFVEFHHVCPVIGLGSHGYWILSASAVLTAGEA